MSVTRREVLGSSLTGPIVLQPVSGAAQVERAFPHGQRKGVSRSRIVGDAANLNASAWPILLAGLCEEPFSTVRAQLKAVDSGMVAGSQASEGALCAIITLESLVALRARGAHLQGIEVLPPPLNGSDGVYLLVASVTALNEPTSRAEIETVIVAITVGLRVASNHRDFAAARALQNPWLLPKVVSDALATGSFPPAKNPAERLRGATAQLRSARHRRAARGAFAPLSAPVHRRFVGWLATPRGSPG